MNSPVRLMVELYYSDIGPPSDVLANKPVEENLTQSGILSSSEVKWCGTTHIITTLLC